MQIYLPSIKTKQGIIGFFDYLLACQDSDEPNVIFNSDLNLENLNDRPGGNKTLEAAEPITDSAHDFLGYVLVNSLNSNSQLFQDLYVRWKLQDKINGVFVEIGTAYPIFRNNTWHLENKMGWTGVCVEPHELFHNSIIEHRKVPLEKRAILSKSHPDVKLRIYHKMDMGGGIDIDYEFKDLPENPNKYQSVNVDTISLLNCLIQYDIDKNFDYLSYDTTGNVDDVSSLEQILSAGYRPSVITIGHNFKSHRPSMVQLLENYNYTKEFDYLSRWDDWFYYNKLKSF